MKMSIALAVAAIGLAAGPAQADISFQMVTDISTFASTTCPAVNRATRSGKEMVRQLEASATQAGLNDEQEYLLITYCNIYLRGFRDGLVR